MTKIKDPQLKKNFSLKTIKKNRVVKECRKEKRIRGIYNYATDVNLTLKNESNAISPKIKKHKNVSTVQESVLEHKVGNLKKKAYKQKRNKTNNENSQSSIQTDEYIRNEFKKIKRKKDRCVQKLSQAEQNRVLPTDTIKKKCHMDTTAINKVNINSRKVATKTSYSTVTNHVDVTSSKVLTKKEKKAQKRRELKDQKLAGSRTEDPNVLASTIFVGNINVNTKRIDLVRLFKDFGPINSIRLRTAGGKILHRHKQRKSVDSLNAYIVLTTKEAAAKALSLNGTTLKDNHLRVTLAAKEDRSLKKDEGRKTVLVGNLKYSATEKSLRELFSSCGEIDYVRCIRDGDKGCKGVAFVCFKAADGIVLALELNGTILDGRPINVERYNVKKLGAKQAREVQADKKGNSKQGVKQRLDNKKGKKEQTSNKKLDRRQVIDGKKPNKSKFKGVKVEGLKKKMQSKKKKSKDQMLQLAKKIAPKNM